MSIWAPAGPGWWGRNGGAWRPDRGATHRGFRFLRSDVHPLVVDLPLADRYARRHRGLLSFEESGLTRRQWNAAIARGEVEARVRNVVRLYGAPTTMEMRIEAAVPAGGPDAQASHRSAASIWSRSPGGRLDRHHPSETITAGSLVERRRPSPSRHGAAPARVAHGYRHHRPVADAARPRRCRQAWRRRRAPPVRRRWRHL